MTLTEKVAYLKGLVEGIGVDETTNNGKIMKAVLDVLDDMAFTVSDLEDSTSELYEEVEAIDEDLSSLEDEIYGEEDDDDCCCHDHDHEHHHHDHDDECGCGHDHDHEHHHHDGECGCGHEHHHHHADEVFTSWGRETIKKYTKENLEKMLEALSASDEYGIILRAKGMLPAEDGTWIYFDMVPEETEIREGAPEYTGRLCVIGSKLNEDKLAELFGL